MQSTDYFYLPSFRSQIFLNHHSGTSPFSSRKFIRGRHPSSPNHLASTFKNRPEFSLIARDASCQKHLLQLPGRSAPPRAVRIPCAPVPQNQRRVQQINVQKLFPVFSFARCERPVNHFQVKACAQFWNMHRRFAASREINRILVRIPPLKWFQQFSRRASNRIAREKTKCPNRFSTRMPPGSCSLPPAR